jgi:hypothetical protein
MPNIVEVGGIHLQPPENKLPKVRDIWTETLPHFYTICHRLSHRFLLRG